MTPTWRNLARALALVVVTCFAGSLLGPVLKGGLGYQWAYLGGIFGPIALVALAVELFVWVWVGPNYRVPSEPQPAQDPDAFRPTRRPAVAGRPHRSGRTWALSLRRDPGSRTRAPRSIRG